VSKDYKLRAVSCQKFLAVAIRRFALRNQQILRIADRILETFIRVRFPKMIGGSRLMCRPAGPMAAQYYKKKTRTTRSIALPIFGLRRRDLGSPVNHPKQHTQNARGRHPPRFAPSQSASFRMSRPPVLMAAGGRSSARRSRPSSIPQRFRIC
jgi:hypothetical protein